jgi:hypothetical protein
MKQVLCFGDTMLRERNIKYCNENCNESVCAWLCGKHLGQIQTLDTCLSLFSQQIVFIYKKRISTPTE